MGQKGDFFKVFPNKTVFLGPSLTDDGEDGEDCKVAVAAESEKCHNASSQLRGRETAAGSASVIRNTIGNTITNTNTNTRETAALAGPGSLKYIWTILPFASLNFSNCFHNKLGSLEATVVSSKISIND